MSFARHRVTATVLRLPGEGRDNWGDELPRTETDIPGCLIAPSAGSGATTSREDRDFSNTVITGATLYLPPGSDLNPSDRLRIRGIVYDVEGDLGDWGPAGMQVALRRTTG